MLPSAKDTLRFTPPSYAGRDDAPVYLLAVPTIRSRAAFRRELQAEGVVFSDDDTVFQALRDAVGRQFDPDTNVDLQRVFDRFVQARRDAREAAENKPSPVEGAEPVPETAEEAEQRQNLEALARQMADLEQEMRRADPAYARVLADNAHYTTIVPLLAAQMFLRGWEGLDAKFMRRGDRATDECLMKVPENDLLQVGWHVMGLFQVSEAQAKN